ncbi:lytic transglycosylase [Rhizobium sp. Root482]|nr:lytic transglycosylase [Rhizobium sp. Root482]
MTPAEIEKLVGSTAEAYDVDPRFAKAITWVETRFDRARNSPKGARGPMQLMPETALQLGVDDVCDPVSNIDGGVRRLKALLDEFQNPLLAAAAYNAGSRAIYDHGGIPAYGETIRYVASVINHQLGLPAQPVGAKAHATVSKDNSSMSNEETNGVFGAKGSRFVNGVMHF